MKVIIDEEKIIDLLETEWGYEGIREEVSKLLRENGIPYDDSGDLISKNEVKKLGATCLARRNENGQLEAIISLDLAPTVEDKQDKLLDYIKLSLKDSDELKEKYRNKHKESNSPHDLYYSHLFEGMAEAYADLLKKMGESDTQGKQDRPKGGAK